MNGCLILAAAVAAVGIDVGWQPLPRGGLECIIQIEPHLVDTLKQGTDIASDLPVGVKNVRSFRFTVGSSELPKIYEPAATLGHQTGNPGLESPDLPDLPDPPGRSDVPPDTVPDDTPMELPWNDAAKDAVIAVGMNQDTNPKPGLPETAESTTNPEDAPPAPSSPWLLATLSIGLMGTSGGMIFAGWTAWDYRGRYRRVLQKLSLEERMEVNIVAGGRTA